jgi:hypothetical protein
LKSSERCCWLQYLWSQVGQLIQMRRTGSSMLCWYWISLRKFYLGKCLSCKMTRQKKGQWSHSKDQRWRWWSSIGT